MSSNQSQDITNSRHDVRDALRDVVPFAASLIMSFTIIGASASAELTLWQALLFTGFVMTAPLQFLIIEEGVSTFPIVAAALAAITINARLAIYSLTLQPDTKRERAVLIPLAVMGNAAYTLMAARQATSKLTLRYMNGVALPLYAAALVGTAVGYIAANFSEVADPMYIRGVAAIFVAGILGRIVTTQQFGTLFVSIAIGITSVMLIGNVQYLVVILVAVLWGWWGNHAN